MIEQDWLDYERDVLKGDPNVLLNEHVIHVMKMTFYIAAGLAARHVLDYANHGFSRATAQSIVDEVDKLLRPSGRLELVKGKVN